MTPTTGWLICYFIFLHFCDLLDCTAWTLSETKGVSNYHNSVIFNKGGGRCQSLELNMTRGVDSKRTKIKRPRLIVFDLDGCLWRPEMYELLYFSGGRGAPFTQDKQNPEILRTQGNEPVKLLGNVRDVMFELKTESSWKGTRVGISSRTDQPTWARELLRKFTVTRPDHSPFAISEVFTEKFCILEASSKVGHFERIVKQHGDGLKMNQILFFDNEYGNCQQIANLGVTVVYCPKGVTTEAWEKAKKNFPVSNGKVIECR
mmetsp:Transcript_21690/g.27972  ORF Transcript_21690/g.27972 Transcript_21690/m.27972 type:complete len:261 (+) Transcript_21690:153-935(+)